MYSGLVTVRGVFVAHTWRKVNRTGNFFVKQNVAHRRKHERVETYSKLPHVSSAFIRIKNGVETLVVSRFASRFDNFALLENETDIAKLLAFVQSRRIVVNNAFDTPLHRCRIDFAVGNVHVAAARHRRNILDAERDIGIGRHKTHLVCTIHEINKMPGRGSHFRIIGKARLEIKVLERLRAHFCRLGHGRIRPAEHAPARIVHAVIQNILHDGSVRKHFLVVDVTIFHRVIRSSNG